MMGGWRVRDYEPGMARHHLGQLNVCACQLGFQLSALMVHGFSRLRVLALQLGDCHCYPGRLILLRLKLTSAVPFQSTQISRHCM